jgi:hypothetical protein
MDIIGMDIIGMDKIENTISKLGRLDVKKLSYIKL